jgi:CHAT domain-containing protein
MKLKTLFLALFTISLLAAQEQNNITLEKLADSLYYSQHTKYSQSNYQKVLQLRQDALLNISDYSSSNYKRILSKLYASKSANFEHKQQYDSAIFYSKKYFKSIGSFKKQNLFFKAHAYIHLYTQTAYNGDWNTAATQCKEALRVLKDTLGNKNHTLIPEVEFDYGYAISESGDYITQLKYYNLSKDHFIALIGENNHEVALKYVHIAIGYGFVGYYKKELDAYKKAIKIWETIDYKDKSYLSIAYGSISTWYLQHGEYNKAELYLNKKEKLIKKSIGKDWYNETYKGRTQVDLWGNFRDLYLQKKDTIKALFYINKELDYLTNLDFNDPDNNPNNINIPFIKTWVRDAILLRLRVKANLIKNTSPEEAKDIYNYILSQKKKDAFSHPTTPESIHLSRYYSKKKEYKKAHNILNNEIAELKKGQEYLLLQMYAEKAKLYFYEDKVLEMHKKYQAVFKSMQIDTLQKIDLENLRYKNCKPYGTKKYLTIVLEAANNYKKAFAKTTNNKYLQIAHNLNLFASEMFATNYAVLNYNDQTHNTVTGINEQLLSSTLALQDETVFENVLQKIEQSSSKLSWHKFLNSNQRKHINIPDSILTKESELKTQLHFYKKSMFLNAETNAEKISFWKEKILDLENDIEQLNKWFQKEYPSYFNQTQKEFHIKAIKQKLKTNQHIVKYIFAKDNVYAFIISKSSTQLIKVDNKNDLTKKLKPLIKSLSKPISKGYKKIAASMYNVLLPKQIINNDVKQDFIFIRDDVLHYLPLEILVDVNGKYLIENNTVSYATSLLLWNEQLQVKKSKTNKFGIYSPTYKKKSNNPKRNDNAELKGANKETIEIAKLFNADVFTGNKASKEAFISTAKSYNILHLAMHSNINNTDSEFSNLAFSETQEDKLFISELYDIKLNADLVVLSACNTAIGNIKKGEGLVNVSKAFTYAGVPSTVTSLWKVPDKETAKIMISFYQFLKDGKTKSEALQLAKLNYLNTTNDALLKHPYYWAGFIVSGDISPINTSSNMLWLYCIIGLFILGFFFRKRTRLNFLSLNEK